MAAAKHLSITNLFSLRGKTAIVTGATGGIGLVLTVTLAECGADIVSIQIPDDPGAKTLQEKVEGLGREFHAFDSDLKDYKTIGGTFEKIWAAGITPDILLNCAGITRHSNIEDTPISYLEDVKSLANFSKYHELTSTGHGPQLQGCLCCVPGIWQTTVETG